MLMSCSPTDGKMVSTSLASNTHTEWVYLTDSGVHEGLGNALRVAVLFSFKDGACDKLKLKL